MPSQDKLIKAGIKYTDKLFDEIGKRLEKGVKASDSLEAFLDKYHKAFPEKGNPLISLGYDKTMIDLILSETNNHRFSRPAQKELVRVTVEEKVGELIVDVGEDIKDSVRDIVRDGYNRNLSQDEIALNISNRVSAIKGKRARAIARTEIARTATVSDYVINRERGANGWYVECRNTACPVCKDRWHKSWTPENDDSFTPSDTSAGGKGWIGDRIFSMNDTGRLPPVHPNCRCVVYYTSEEPNVSTEPVQQTTSTTVEEQVEEVIEEPQSVNPRIAELEKEISEQQKIVDKWRNRGNESLAKSFEATIKNLQKELNQLKNQNTPNNQSTDIKNKDLIDNVLTDVLNDIGLGDKAPKTKSEAISKDIKTTHESNLWENLAKKHDLELIEASNSFVKYYDKEFDTRIEFNINSNKDWIDYTNSNKKDRNMEEFLKYYKEAPSNYKKASPPIKIIGSAPYDGVCELNTSDTHHIKIARSGYCEMKMQPGSGNLQQTMYHEMSHAFDQRHAPDRVMAVMSKGYWWSSQKGGIYKKSTTKDRRNRKKTGGKQFVSDYAKTGSSGGNLTEDMAELGSIVAMRDLKDKSNAYLYEYNEQGEYVKVYYDELKKRYPNKWNALEHEIFEGDIVW